MPLLRRLRLGHRLAAAFSVLVALMLAVVAAGLIAGAAQGRAAQRLHAQERFGIAAATAKHAAADLNGWQTAYAFDAVRGVAAAAQDGSGSRQAYLDSAERFEQALQVLAQRSTVAETDDDIAQVAELYERFAALDEQVAAGYRSGEPAAAAAATELVMGEEIELYTAMGVLLDEVVADAANAFEAAQADAVAAEERGAVLMTVLGGAGVALAVLLAVLVTRSVTAPVARVRDRLVLLAQGDLASEVHVDGRDELSEMAGALQHAVGTLTGTMRRIAGASTTLAASSEELSAVATQLSSGAVQASSQSQVVSAATEEISA
ncbi:HAMP domain-containing protein, partial [Kineococcus sp. SYSU DK005]|uniref:HAMP domain-containing protein n=1 Tax=Kineococcus sp. SYSU DK005 TaxID=3383126 RepID=UPI003D7E05F6